MTIAGLSLDTHREFHASAVEYLKQPPWRVNYTGQVSRLHDNNTLIGTPGIYFLNPHSARSSDIDLMSLFSTLLLSKFFLSTLSTYLLFSARVCRLVYGPR